MAGYRFRSILGTLLMVGGFLLFSYGLIRVLRIGTCASGGPYVSARQCPGGMGWLVGAMFAGILMMLAGAFTFLLRGNRPGRDGKSTFDHISWGVMLFGLLFLGIGLVAIYGAFGPGSNDAPGAELGAGIVAVIFIPMGLIPIVFELRSARRDAKEGKPVGTGPLSGLMAQASSLSAMAQNRMGDSRSPSAGFTAEGLRKLAEMQAASQATPGTAPAGSPPPGPVATTASPKLTSSGIATVKAFKYMGQSSGDATLVEFDLEVVAGGNPAAYELLHQQMVPLDKTKGLADGGQLRVRVDRENPAELTIEW